MDFDTGRRRFLEISGVGTAMTLAGCSALQNADTETSSDGTAESTSQSISGDTVTVTIAVQADQQKLKAQNQKIRSELQAGNITRREAQQKAQQVRKELTKESVTTFSERVRSNSDLTVKDTVGQFGVLLVSGAPAALINALSVAEVSALLPEATFQKAKSQAARQTGTPTSN